VLLGFQWGSLRTKIIAWSFVPTAIILGAVALVNFTAYRQVTEDLVIQRNRELTRLSASQLATELTAYSSLLADEARDTDIRRNDAEARRSALQRARNRLTIFDGGALILDNYGTVVAAEPERLDVIGQDWSDRRYFSQMLTSPGPVFSDIVADGPGGAEVIIAAMPIIGDRDEFQGIMVGMFRLGARTISAFYGDVVKLRIGVSGNVYLVDGNGRAIYHSDIDSVGQDLSGQTIVQQVLDGQVDAVHTRDADGRDIVASAAPVPGTDWGLVTQESWSALLAASQGPRRFLLLLLALGVVVPAFVVAVGARRLTKPIVELTVAAQEVAGGRFGQTITAETKDEIEDLAVQFNRMSAQLQESYAHLEERVIDRTRELAVLNAIATTLNQSLRLDVILSEALDKTLEVMGVEVGGIYLLDEAAGVLNIATQRGFDPQFVAEIDRLAIGEGFSGHVTQSGQPLVVHDVSTDPRLTRMVIREEGLRSLAVVPLASKGRVLGTLFAVAHGLREFTDQDVQLLTSIGFQIGVAVENARLFKAEQRQAEQFRVISEVGHQITSILDIDKVLAQVVRLIRQAFGYDHVGIGLIEGDQVVYKVGAGKLWDDPQFQFQPGRLRVGQEGITGWVAASGEPLLVPDVTREPRYIMMQGSKTRSELTVPIKVKGETVGVLDVQSDHFDTFDKSDLVVFQSLADQTGVAIENAQLFLDAGRQVRDLSALADASRIISSVLDRDQLLPALYEQIACIAPADFYVIALYDEAANIVSIEICVDEGVPYPPTQYVLDKGLLKLVIHGRQALRFESVTEEAHRFGVEVVTLGSSKLNQGWIGVPMLFGNKVMGAIVVGSYERGVFDERHQQALTSIANQAAVALENARLYGRAQELAVVEERSRLARDLHDAVTQTLFSSSLIAEALPALWESNPEEGRQLLRELRQLSRGALAEMRTLLLELRPAALVEANLGDLLRQLGEAMTGRTGVPVTVAVEGRCALPSDVHVSLYRIAQEALNNVVKHSDASQVTVELRCTSSSRKENEQQEECVELQVSDNGRGFDPKAIPHDRLGLGIIRERAQAIGATLEIESQPGLGTKVTICWKKGA
jgi:nitrate/nitrite-specific signal transduction histidine kinase